MEVGSNQDENVAAAGLGLRGERDPGWRRASDRGEAEPGSGRLRRGPCLPWPALGCLHIVATAVVDSAGKLVESRTLLPTAGRGADAADPAASVRGADMQCTGVRQAWAGHSPLLHTVERRCTPWLLIAAPDGVSDVGLG